MNPKLKILHLEDNNLDAELINNILENEGFDFDIRRIETKEQFILEIENNAYDLILADYMLPAFDALTALKILQEKKIDVPFLVVSGVIGEEFAIDSIKAGVTDYVLKNRLARLGPSVKRIIEDRAKKDTLEKVEKQFATSHTELSTLITSAIDGVISITPQGEIRIFNESAKKLFQYSKDENFEINITKLIPDLLKNLDKKSIIELKGITKEGKHLHLEVSISEYIIEGKHNYMIVFRDITDRILLETSLLDSQNHAHLGSWVFDLRTEEIKWTDEVFNIFDLPWDRPTPLFEEYFSMIHPDDQAMMIKVISEGGEFQKDYDVDHRIVTAQGKLKWVQAIGKYKMDVNGNIDFLQGTVQDITERKNREEELKIRNQEMDNFVYRVSHDIRAPICTIQGIINIWQGEKDKSTQNHYLTLINNSIDKLFTFVNQTISHSENLNMPIKKEKIDFEKIILEIFQSYEYYPNFSRLKLLLNISNDDFYSDLDRVKVIINAMMANSVKFMDTEKTECFIEITVKKIDNLIKIIFRDNGVGIEEEILPKIFDMFFRGNSKSNGAGLGLYILKQYVNKLEGSVQASSIEGEGATLELSLPNL